VPAFQEFIPFPREFPSPFFSGFTPHRLSPAAQVMAPSTPSLLLGRFLGAFSNSLAERFGAFPKFFAGFRKQWR
jgi:hypothetical protein